VQSIVLEIVAKEYIVLALSRVAGGCASGMISTACMVYMSEIALPQFRGALLGAFSLSFALGQVFLAIGLKALDATSPMQFRRIFYSEFVFFVLWMIPALYLPDTPGKENIC
jgi:MFS family permease